MAQFIAFDPNVEVSGLSMQMCIGAFPAYHRARLEDFLHKNNIANPVPGTWASQQSWLNVFKEISTSYGQHTLFNIGVTLSEALPFPPQVADLEAALHAFDVVYNMNHRNGNIGFGKLISFDAQAQKAVMECKNPYSCHFERGLITGISRRFPPLNAKFVDVQLDKSKPSRLDGADSSFYIITWF